MKQCLIGFRCFIVVISPYVTSLLFHYHENSNNYVKLLLNMKCVFHFLYNVCVCFFFQNNISYDSFLFELFKTGAQDARRHVSRPSRKFKVLLSNLYQN
jgi:hypothetical protein